MAVAIRELDLNRVTDDGKRLSGVLRAIRKERGWSQREVAERWDMTVDGYRPYEQGRRQLRFAQIEGLARALEISEVDLVTRLGMKVGESDDTSTVRLELARDLAALAASELAELLAKLRPLSPATWQEVIEGWRVQPSLPLRRRPDGD